MTNAEDEIWKDIEGFEGFYQVSSAGRVRSIPRQIVSKDGRRWMQPGRAMTIGRHHNGGYSTVVLCRNNKPRAWLVHRLVASAFIPNIAGLPEVNHIDGRKDRNGWENLEWVNRQANIDHAVATALIDNKGVNNQQAKLDEKTVRKILQLYAEGMSAKTIAAATGATARNVQNITSRTSWKHIDMEAA